MIICIRDFCEVNNVLGGEGASDMDGKVQESHTCARKSQEREMARNIQMSVGRFDSRRGGKKGFDTLPAYILGRWSN